MIDSGLKKCKFLRTMRFLILIAVTLISGCDVLNIEGEKKYTANIEFKTSRLNNNPETHEVTVSLFDNGVKQELQSVKLNDNPLNKNYQNIHMSTDLIDSVEYKVLIDLGEGLYDDQQVFESIIKIKPNPTFFIKLANNPRGLQASATQNYTASIDSSNYVGFDINSANIQYQMTGIAYVQGANGEKSKEYSISNSNALTSKLLSGDFTSFKPDKLILKLTFSYNGNLSNSFKDGYIRRVYEIRQEIDLSD